MQHTAQAFARRWLPSSARSHLVESWAAWWMRVAGAGLFPRTATRMAGLAVPPFYGRHKLARFHPRGYTAPSATIHHDALRRGAHTSIGDRVLIYQDIDGGAVDIEDGATLNLETCIQTGYGGSVRIGAATHVQPRCQFSAYVGSIIVGADVSIAPSCSFYPYNHAMDAAAPIRQQGLQSGGDIVVGDGAWLGSGVTVLDGVKIGAGAVVAAGAVVTHDVPDHGIAAGVPAKVIGTRAHH